MSLVLAAATLAVAGWYAAALYLGPPHASLGAAAVALAGLVAAVTLATGRVLALPLVAWAVAVAGAALVWSGVTPTNDRDWQPDVARLPYATFDGDRVTIHDVRNFEYRTETDFTPRYVDKTYDLRDLDSADLIVCYWMGDAIAHVMLSFGFADRDFLAISIETRKARGQSYSTVRRLLPQLRAHLRRRRRARPDPPANELPEGSAGRRLPLPDEAPKENVRRLFLDYVKTINSLHDHPQFYNTVTTNCTTNVLMHTSVNPGGGHYSWKVLLSGYVPQYAYERGRLDTGVPFDELRRRSRINDPAKAADHDPEFSLRIREHLPRPPAAMQ